jgi:hypothetical protein
MSNVLLSIDFAFVILVVRIAVQRTLIFKELFSELEVQQTNQIHDTVL